nr:MAG TPA: hypothetical protein [Bacteriophage sp.]
MNLTVSNRYAVAAVYLFFVYLTFLPPLRRFSTILPRPIPM